MGGRQTTISKNKFTRLSGISVLAAALFFAAVFARQAEVFAHQIDTISSIAFSKNPACEGDIVTITGTTLINGTQHDAVPGTPVTTGTIKIQQLQLAGSPVACGTTGADYVDVASGTPNSSGQLSYAFNTAGLAGQSIGFRTHYVTPGGHPAPATGQSTCDTLSIITCGPPCSGVTIGATLASGDGTPCPGVTGCWEFRITVTACEAVTNVTAQGGTSGWTTYDSFSASTGSAALRMPDKKGAQILVWTIGNMAKDEVQTLDVKVCGAIPSTSPDGEARYLSGPWSAKYTIGSTQFKSAYSGRVSLTVTVDGDCE